MRAGRRVLSAVLAATLAVGLHLGVATAQSSRFPSDDPDVRVGTPNDPGFDCAEPDDEDPDATCASVFDEQYQLFGFAPASTRLTATYKDGSFPPAGQVSGVRADAAWKTTTGHPDVVVAVTDTGMDWDAVELRRQAFLNVGELPLPSGASTHDADGDGVVTVDDWAGDPRVSDANGNGLLDGQDLIRAFSDGTDADGNGYVDDIHGWDWLNDDNDPSDDSSTTSASLHGRGRMLEAAGATDNGIGDAGICPRCRVLALRVFDSFVVPADNWAAATVYTADIGASVQVVANAVLGNSDVTRAATTYAHESGVALMHVSSDLNTANHNYPTAYPESVFINGCVADVEGLGGQGNEIVGPLTSLGLPVGEPVQTWFRQAGLTQYGAKADVCFMGATGSQATGQAGGGAGLVMARGLEVADAIGGPLTAGEVTQVLTMSAEDVLPENTVGVGVPDAAQPGWDEKFGYGRADLGAAVAMVAPGAIPPDVALTAPEWWHLLDPVAQPSVPVTGRVRAPRTGSFTWDVGWAAGVEPADDAFTSFGSGAGTETFTGTLGSLPLTDVAAALPGAAEGTPPDDPNTYVFTVRVRVTTAEDVVGEDRRAFFAFHDPDQPDGWPRFVDVGGEASQLLWDLDGDGALEIVEADTSGRISVTGMDGRDAAFFNGGEPLRLPPPVGHHPGAPGFRDGAVPTPSAQPRTPAIADLDGDLLPEIVVATVDGRVFAFGWDGTPEPGWPVSIDRSLSREAVQSPSNHVKPGFLAAPAIDDLEGDGELEVVAAGLDGHVYAWGPDGRLLSGFPVGLADPAQPEFNGGELVVTPGIGDIDGDEDLEIVLMSNEVYDAEQPGPPSSPGDLQSGVAGLVLNVAANAAGGSARLYALHHDGTLVDGWPVAMNGLAPAVLPLVGPAHPVALGDLDDDGDVEVVASMTSGDVTVFDGDGSRLRTLPSDAAIGTTTDPTKILNLFEYGALGDVDGIGGLDYTKVGISLNGVVNLLAAGQNLPFDHVVQAWDASAALPLPGYPTSHDDYLLVSSPAILDVGGQEGNEIVAGSGLYLLHAYGPLGRDAPGFPKLTGGWTIGVPTAGDLDGDGDLELLAATREGWRHLWDLDAPATADGLDEWWTESHDERHTLRHGADTRPPLRVQDARTDATATSSATTVTFTAPGDDWRLGQVAAYELRAAAATSVPRDGWGDEQVLRTLDATAPPGASVTLPLDVPDGTRLVALVAVDDAGNRSQPAVVTVDGSPAPDPAPPSDPAPDPGGGDPDPGGGDPDPGGGDADGGSGTNGDDDRPLPATGGGAGLAGIVLVGVAVAARSRSRG